MQKRWLGFFGIVMLIVAAVAVNRYYLPGLAYQDNAADSVGNFSLKLKEPSVLYGMVVDDFLVIEDKIKRNERLGDILLEYNVPARLIHQVSQVSRNIFDVRKIVPNKKYTLICNQDSLKTAK